MGILTAFVPTIILNIIGHMSNYFKEFFFEGLMSLNVTVMLVLTTMFISISDNLPKTAYIKMIDIWLIFNLTKPFVDILMQTYVETLRENEEPSGQKEVHAWEENLRAADESKQKNALENYYSRAVQNRKRHIGLVKTFLKIIYPGFCLLF